VIFDELLAVRRRSVQGRWDNGEVVGYVINGFGIVEEFYRIEVLP